MVRLVFETFNKVLDCVFHFYLENPRILLIVVVGALFLFHYLHNVVKKPLLFVADGKFKWFLQANCPTLTDYYWPTIWCYQTNVLTPLATVLRGFLPTLKYHREYIRVTDGGQISLDWYDPEGDGQQCPSLEEGGHSRCTSKVHQALSAPIALFLPGVTGCSQSEYLKSFVPIAHRLGYRAVAFNYRGMGDTELLTPKLYCGADDQDLREALAHIRASNPNAKVVATGISLGGVILAHYLVSTGERALVDAAYLVSVVWNFQEALPNMERLQNIPINKFVTRSLKEIVNKHQDRFTGLPQYDLDRVKKCSNLREFDENFTIKMFNYPTAGDYYRECVNKGKISAIKKPTLCLNSLDDMFAPIETLPIDEAELSSHVALLVTARGGHIGFMDSYGFFGMIPNLTYSYMERLLEDYLLSLIKLHDFRQELPDCKCRRPSLIM